MKFNGFFSLKDNVWLENQRYAGKVLAQTLSIAEDFAKEGVSTSSIDKVCEDFILSNKGKPTFKGYTGFPTTTCISINEEVVHGVPKDNVFLKYGDIVKVDCGVTYNGAIADSAISFVVGDYIDSRHKELLVGCKDSLDKVIDLIGRKIGSIRLGDVGHFIKREASRIGASSIKELTGHGLELDTPHWYPPVYNYGDKNRGIVLVPGMTICIEPIFVFGGTDTYIKEDKFTIAAESVGIHWEHTIFLHNDSVEIITKRDNEKSK